MHPEIRVAFKEILALEIGWRVACHRGRWRDHSHGAVPADVLGIDAAIIAVDPCHNVLSVMKTCGVVAYGFIVAGRTHSSVPQQVPIEVVARSLNAALTGAVGHDETIYSIDGIHMDVAIGKACVVRHKNAVTPWLFARFGNAVDINSMLGLRASVLLEISDNDIIALGVDGGIGIGVIVAVVGTMHGDAVEIGNGGCAVLIEMRDIGVIYATYAVVKLIDIAATFVVGSGVMDIAGTYSLLFEQKRFGENLFAVFVVSCNEDFLVVIGIALESLLGIHHKDIVFSGYQNTIGAFFRGVFDGGLGMQGAVGIDILQEGAVHVGAQGPHAAVIACEHLGAASSFTIEEHHAMFTPGEGTIGIDFDRPMVRSKGAEHRDYTAVNCGHGIAWRPGGEVGRGDMDAVGRPLWHTVEIKSLQPW